MLNVLTIIGLYQPREVAENRRIRYAKELRLGSGLLTPIMRRGTAKTNFTKNRQLLTRGLKKPYFLCQGP